MSVEDIIKRILTIKPNLNKETVEQLIEEERIKTAGLLTEEAAAHLVASNLGINGTGKKIDVDFKIGDLTAGLNDVNLTGRIIQIFPSRTFDRDNQRQGKVLRMIIGDATGTITLVFWDEKADQVEVSKLKPGKIIRLLHGYSRERRGNIEVNLGNRGLLFMEPFDAIEENFPKIESFFITPAEVFNEGLTHLQGVVTGDYPIYTFQRQDGSEGKVSRLTIEEGGSRINLVLWNDKVDEFGGIEKGTRIRIISGNARKGNNGVLEIHIGWESAIQIIEKDVKPIESVPYWTKIGDLKDRMSNINVAAIVTNIDVPREFIRKDGSGGRVVSLLLEDDSGTIRLSLWDDDVDKINEIIDESIIVIENGYTRAGYGGVDLHAGRSSRVHIDPIDLDIELPKIERKITRIIDLRENQKNITIQGRLIDDPIQRDIDTVRGPATVSNFRIDDGTGEARISLWGKLAEETMELTVGAQIRLEYVNVREPFDGLIQVSSGNFTNLIIEKE